MTTKSFVKTLRGMLDGLGPGTSNYLAAVEHLARHMILAEDPGDAAEHFTKLVTVIREQVEAEHA